MKPTILQKTLDQIGGLADEGFLLPPRLFKNMVPKRKTDRATFEAELDFYFDRGFVRNPESFFRLPGDSPQAARISRKEYNGGAEELYRFESGYEVRNPLLKDRYEAFGENRNGYLVRWVHGDRPRDTVLCLHGFMLGDPDQAEAMFKISSLYRAGLDAALFIAPFHWRRAPGKKASRRVALQPDNPAMTAEFMGQAVHDIASCLGILKKLGSPRTGIIGASLGGYLGGIFASLSSDPAFAALMVPAVHFGKPLGPDGFTFPFPVDRGFRDKINAVWTFHTPLNLNLAMDPEKILIIASRGDRLCPFEYTRALADKWQGVEAHFLTGGHWLVFNRSQRGRAWYAFLQRMGFLP